jgi:signal transduction histidine kinase/CheY-like chemotaxis protein
VDAERGGKADALRRGLQALLEEVALTDAPIHELQQVILCLRDGLLEGEVSPELEAVFRRALVQVGQTMHRLEGKRRLHDEDLTERLRANWERLSASSLDLPALRSALTMQMPWLSILNGFVGMYVRDNPNLLVTLACVTDGQPVALDEQPYPAQKLLPDKVLITPNRRSLAVFPLTFEWQELGVAVLELPQNHELYAMLREQIGSAVKTVQLHEDILKQARLSAQAEEEKRVTAERLRSLGLVAGGVAHDLNNVLGPLVGLPEAISHDLLRAVGEGVPRKVFEDLDIIRLAGLRAADTIQDLLTLGQQKPAPKVALDLNLLLANEWRAITALAESNPQVVVRVKTGDTPLIVHASKPHLMRAISNLVINAADAIRGPGTITVRAAARVLTEPRSGIESIDPGQYAVVEVEDTGAGIPPENLARILEPFFTTKQSNERRGGTGLGLAIVHRIANDSLGYVEVESQLGQGSKFSLYFPLQQEEDVHSSSRPAPATRGSERILVIDDEPVQLRTARRILEQLGYSVTTARSGEAGLALLNEALSIREFELVVLDMMMPGLDGLETLKRIRTVRPGQKALIVTGFTPQQSNRTSEDPPHLWLPKPYTPDALGRAVRHALDG